MKLCISPHRIIDHKDTTLNLTTDIHDLRFSLPPSYSCANVKHPLLQFWKSLVLPFLQYPQQPFVNFIQNATLIRFFFFFFKTTKVQDPKLKSDCLQQYAQQIHNGWLNHLRNNPSSNQDDHFVSLYFDINSTSKHFLHNQLQTRCHLKQPNHNK